MLKVGLISGCESAGQAHAYDKKMLRQHILLLLTARIYHYNCKSSIFDTVMASLYKHIRKPSGGNSGSARRDLGLGPGEIVTSDTFRDLMLVCGLTKRMNVTLGSLVIEDGLWSMAMDLAMDGDDRVAFRSSWALEWAYSIAPERFGEFIPRFIDDFLRARNHSVNRVYSKMLCDMMRRGAVTLTDEQAGLVAQKSFDLLVNPRTATAIRAWQIELLWNISHQADWIEESLTEIVRAMSERPECSPGEAAHARHYFRRLAKSRRISR